MTLIKGTGLGIDYPLPKTLDESTIGYLHRIEDT